jgi:hypothetical protein
MPFIPFHDKFPQLAEQETRTFTILQDGTLPAADYKFMELYCDETDCDCRRVFFYLISSKNKGAVAVITYGWENLQFYKRWLSFDDPQMVKDMKGPGLNFGSPQSESAPAVLDVVKTVVLQDEHYIERLKTHYQLFRSRIDSKTNARRLQAPKKSRPKRSSKRKSTRRK